MSPEDAGPERLAVGRPPRRPAGGGQPPRADARERRDVRGRVPLPAAATASTAGTSAAPCRCATTTGTIAFWVGTATDIHDRKLIEEQRDVHRRGERRALAHRSTTGRRSRQVAELAAGEVADWCAVHIVEPDGTISEVAVAHADPAKVTFARELQERYPPDPGAPTGVAGGDPHRRAGARARDHRRRCSSASARDELHRELLRAARAPSYMCVPLKGRDRVLGAITFISVGLRHAASGADELIFAEELARRAASAIENARLYREAEARAQAARVLATIGDGVCPRRPRAAGCGSGTRAAERITGMRRADVLGRSSSPTRFPAGRRSQPRAPDRAGRRGRRAPRASRSSSASASCGSRSRRSATRTAPSTRSATSPRSGRSRRCGRTSSRPSRTSCARRSPRSTAPR